MWHLSFPTRTHAIQECKQKRKRSQQKGTKADTRHVREGTFPYREYMFVDTPCTLKRNMWHPFLKASISPEGWNGLSELTGSWWGGGQRLGWAVRCLQLDTQLAVWTRTSCCPSDPPFPCGWWCFLWTLGASLGREHWFSQAEGLWALSLS